MKRKGLVALVLLVALLGTGCGASQTTLTKEENDMVAEYMAGLLLKYDLRYDEKLVYEKEEENEPVDSFESVKKEETVPEKIETVTEAEVETETDASITYQPISKIYEADGCTVEYIDAKEYQMYPKTKEDNYFLLEAADGKKLLLLNFEVKNDGNEEKTFSLVDSKIQYVLENKNGKTYRPLLTVLVDDLQYLDVKIAPGKSKKAVIVFELPEKAEKKDSILYITKKDDKARIDIE